MRYRFWKVTGEMSMQLLDAQNRVKELEQQRDTFMSSFSEVPCPEPELPLSWGMQVDCAIDSRLAFKLS